MIIATAIIGTSVVAILDLVIKQTVTLKVTSEISEAVHLANNIHEFALSLPLMSGPGSAFTSGSSDPRTFSNVMHLNGWNSGSAGPINCDADQITGLPGWKQSSVVEPFNLEDPRVTVAATNGNARKLTVTVTRNDQHVYACSWILAPTVQ